MRFIIFLSVVLTFFALSSCDESRVYETNYDIANKAWNEDSITSFTFQIPDNQKRYNLYYNIRNTRAYPYHNIYLKYSLEDSVGGVISSGLHNINLFDPKTGKPYGDGLGDIFDHQVLSIEGFQFDYPGKFRFKIQQYMRMEELPEIISIGLRVEKAE